MSMERKNFAGVIRRCNLEVKTFQYFHGSFDERSIPLRKHTAAQVQIVFKPYPDVPTNSADVATIGTCLSNAERRPHHIFRQ